MGSPVVFNEANTTLSGGNTGAKTIQVWRDQGKTRLIECWAMEPDELEEIAKSGRVWVEITGAYIPPLFVGGKTPFIQGDAAEKYLLLEDKERALKRIADEMNGLPDHYFEGDNLIAKLMTRIRAEASHA